jgi:hypothetical protein
LLGFTETTSNSWAPASQAKVTVNKQVRMVRIRLLDDLGFRGLASRKRLRPYRPAAIFFSSAFIKRDSTSLGIG